MTVISASILPLAALYFTPLPARSSLCVLEALRCVVGGASMTTPGGTRTPCQSVPATPPCSAHRLLSWVGASLVYFPPALRIASSRCPKPSSALVRAAAHNTRRYEHPLVGGSGPIGAGL